MGKLITAPGVLKNVQGQIDHALDLYQDIKDNNLKPLTITIDPVTNANGSYSHTTSDSRITEDMKAVTIEVGTPECFFAPVTITTGDGTVTLTCADAHGTSTVTVTFIHTWPIDGGEDVPASVTSTEFDILADRIGVLSNLETTTKSDIVSAVNEVKSTLSDEIATEAKTSDTVGNVEDWLATLGASMENNQFKNIKFATSNTSGVFRASTSYIGTIKRIASGYYNVDLQDSYAADSIQGLYSNSTWKWSNAYSQIETLFSSLSDNADLATLSSGLFTFTSAQVALNKIISLPSDFPTDQGGRAIVSKSDTDSRYYLLQDWNGNNIYIGNKLNTAQSITWNNLKIENVTKSEYIEVASDSALKTALDDLVSTKLSARGRRVGIIIRYTASGGSLTDNTNYGGFLMTTFGTTYYYCEVWNATGNGYFIGNSNGTWTFKKITTTSV